MRIVSGAYRGRNIKAPPGEQVRPTADRVREAWLNIVMSRLPGATVLDLCAGSGALGIEGLSRGAVHADFVERDPNIILILKANIESVGATPKSTIWKKDAIKFVMTLDAHAFDVTFADPPYATDVAVRLAERWLEVPFTKLLGIEHASTVVMPPGGDTRRYGTSSITFYR